MDNYQTCKENRTDCFAFRKSGENGKNDECCGYCSILKDTNFKKGKSCPFYKNKSDFFYQKKSVNVA